MLTVLFATALAAQPSKRPTDAERGEQLYRRHCVACHGTTNQGDGPATAQLVVSVPDLVGKVTAEGDMVRSVDKGKGAMPGYASTFEVADAIRVLKYMKTLGPDHPLPPEGAAVAPRKPAPQRTPATERPTVATPAADPPAKDAPKPADPATP
jgi:mono/diheme cytochrome c family protein